MKRLPLILLIAIPAAAVVMSSITMYFAFQGPNQEIKVKKAPLSKTSWRPTETDKPAPDNLSPSDTDRLAPGSDR